MYQVKTQEITFKKSNYLVDKEDRHVDIQFKMFGLSYVILYN